MANGQLPPGRARESSTTNPPPTIEDQRELFFPAIPSRIHAFDFGIAFGIAAVVFMLLSIIIALAVNPSGLKFFEDVFHGFNLSSFPRILLGLLWAFGTGFVLGTLTGLLYNLRLRRYVIRS